MKTALYITDCSVDAALALRWWMTTDAEEAIHLTVVHSYNIEVGTSLNKEVCRAAKQLATARINNWLKMFNQAWVSEVKSETLLASPELAITLHVLLRSYDYLLLDEQDISETTLRQTKAKVCRLTNHERARFTI